MKREHALAGSLGVGLVVIGLGVALASSNEVLYLLPFIVLVGGLVWAWAAPEPGEVTVREVRDQSGGVRPPTQPPAVAGSPVPTALVSVDAQEGTAQPDVPIAPAVDRDAAARTFELEIISEDPSDPEQCPTCGRFNTLRAFAEGDTDKNCVECGATHPVARPRPPTLVCMIGPDDQPRVEDKSTIPSSGISAPAPPVGPTH
jgi:hypothetical protein